MLGVVLLHGILNLIVLELNSMYIFFIPTYRYQNRILDSELNSIVYCLFCNILDVISERFFCSPVTGIMTLIECDLLVGLQQPGNHIVNIQILCSTVSAAAGTRNIRQTKTGWWFGTFFVFPYIGNVIIPIDFHIFQRGWLKPPTSVCKWIDRPFFTIDLLTA